MTTEFLFYTTLTAFVVLCLIFVLLILVQKGRGGGISSAFGGAGGNTAFGSKTGDVLTWATSIVFGIFLLMCVALNRLAANVNTENTTSAAAMAVAPKTSTDNPATPTTAPSNTTVAIPDVEKPNATPTPATPSTQPGGN